MILSCWHRPQNIFYQTLQSDVHFKPGILRVTHDFEADTTRCLNLNVKIVENQHDTIND